MNYRPEYHHEWTNKSYYTQLRLDPLGGADGAAMLAALLGEAVELNPLKRLITERTGGNPFFIEEIVQALFDEGALVRNGAVKVTRSLSQLRLPPTVQGMLAARIDRQPSEHKELLQTLAVIGRESSLGLLKAGCLTRGYSTGADARGSAGGRVHLRAAGRRRCRVRLQARADPGGRLQLVTHRAAQTIARARRASAGVDVRRVSWTII